MKAGKIWSSSVEYSKSMSLDAKGAEHTGDAAHGAPAQAPEAHEKPHGKKVSEDSISRGSAQDGIAPVKGSPVGR